MAAGKWHPQENCIAQLGIGQSPAGTEREILFPIYDVMTS